MTVGHADPAFLAKLARRAQLNRESMIAFGAAIASLVGVFIVFRLMRLVPSKTCQKVFPISLLRARVVLSRKTPILPSIGHLVVISLYITINLVVTFTNFDNSNMPLHVNISSRTGWMAIANLFIVVLLALKNTPFALLTSFSYERLNILHRVAGYTTVAFVIIHASCYSSYFASINFLSRLTQMNDICGMVAGGSLLCMAISGGFIRRWWYELFYYVHITFWILTIIMVGLHQPAVAKKAIFVTCAAASLWILDRLIRIFGFALNATNNTITLTPLPCGGTRIILAKPPIRARSGKHCFLWVPSIRLLETHPFTIAATRPLEFVVASYDGFTGALHQYAVEHAGVPLKASVEGPYGVLPQLMRKDKIVLVAGGSGASFTVGVSLDLLNKMGDTEKTIEFIWIVRDQAYIAWFSEHLKTLKNDPRVSIKVFVTRGSTGDLTSAKSTTTSASRSITTSADPEKCSSSKPSVPAPDLILHQDKICPVSPETPISPACTNSVDLSGEIPVVHGRPDVTALVRTAIESTPKDKSVLVMSCGPERLMTVVRNTTASCIRTDGPSVELHCEQFEW